MANDERRAHGDEPSLVKCASPAGRADIRILGEFDQRMELIIRELTLRILVPQWSEFDAVLESANKVCDRYQLDKAA